MYKEKRFPSWCQSWGVASGGECLVESHLAGGIWLGAAAGEVSTRGLRRLGMALTHFLGDSSLLGTSPLLRRHLFCSVRPASSDQHQFLHQGGNIAATPPPVGPASLIAGHQVHLCELPASSPSSAHTEVATLFKCSSQGLWQKGPSAP